MVIGWLWPWAKDGLKPFGGHRGQARKNGEVLQEFFSCWSASLPVCTSAVEEAMATPTSSNSRGGGCADARSLERAHGPHRPWGWARWACAAKTPGTTAALIAVWAKRSLAPIPSGWRPLWRQSKLVDHEATCSSRPAGSSVRVKLTLKSRSESTVSCVSTLPAEPDQSVVKGVLTGADLL